MLCDASRLFAEAFASVLIQRGHDVVGLCFDARALRHAPPAEADICVVDFGRPGDDLPKLVDAAGLHSATLLALTAEEDAAPLISAGVAGLISKRRGLDEIVEVIQRLWKGASYHDPGLVRRPRRKGARAARELTPRELEVLHHLVRGASTGGMAASMGISVTTVRTHTQSIFHKLGVNSRLQAAACAVRFGLANCPKP